MPEIDYKAEYERLTSESTRNEQLAQIAKDTGMSASALQRLDRATPGVQYAKRGDAWFTTYNGKEAELDAFVKSEWADFESALYPESGSGNSDTREAATVDHGGRHIEQGSSGSGSGRKNVYDKIRDKNANLAKAKADAAPNKRIEDILPATGGNVETPNQHGNYRSGSLESVLGHR